MGGFRAKDADRERYVAVIEAAYVDGQLGDADRELRVSRALTAETLDELEGLTRDLQNRPAPVVVPAPAPTRSTDVPARPAPSADSSSAGKVIGVVAAVVTAIVFIGAATSMHGMQEDWASGTDSAVVPWEQADTGSVDGSLLSAAQVRTFVRRYEAKFHTGEAYGVTFFPDRVSADVPGRGATAQVEVWTWDGDWRREGGAQPAGAPTATVDLATLAVGALFDNIEVAKTDLGVSDARLARIVVRPTPDGSGAVTIHVRNGRTESAFLETTLQGKRLRSVRSEG